MMIKTFAGFDMQNPQHMMWLKRKIARQKKYLRQARRPSGVGTQRTLPRHRCAKPPPELRAPMGRDEVTMMWQAQLRQYMFAKPMPHPQYRRHALTGRIL